jgi:2-iminoacetate synthase
MTLQEYLLDYAKPETRNLGEKLIHSQMLNIPNPRIREIVTNHLQQIKQGSRAFRI